MVSLCQTIDYCLNASFHRRMDYLASPKKPVDGAFVLITAVQYQNYMIGADQRLGYMILLNSTIFHFTIICFWYRIFLKIFENLYQQVEFSI